MCRRYTIVSSINAIEQELQAEFQYSFDKIYNAHHGQELPVILAGEENKIVKHQWGLVPYWSRNAAMKYKHLHAPARNIVKSPLSRVPIRKRRCLIPANCFFIWVKHESGRSFPFLVYDSRQRIFTMAGIWDEWINKERTTSIRSFSIITTTPNNRLSGYCSQMPVIIPPGRRRKYLRAGIQLGEVMRMLRPEDSDSINLFAVSDKINDVNINSRDVLAPIGQRVYKEYEYVPKVYLKLEGMGDMKDNPDRKPEIKLML